MTVFRSLARLRFCTACTFSLALLVAGLWSYRLNTTESAAAAQLHEHRASCRQFTAEMRKKPLQRYSASDIERLNACNALVSQDRDPASLN